MFQSNSTMPYSNSPVMVVPYCECLTKPFFLRDFRKKDSIISSARKFTLART